MNSSQSPYMDKRFPFSELLYHVLLLLFICVHKLLVSTIWAWTDVGHILQALCIHHVGVLSEAGKNLLKQWDSIISCIPLFFSSFSKDFWKFKSHSIGNKIYKYKEMCGFSPLPIPLRSMFAFLILMSTTPGLEVS